VTLEELLGARELLEVPAARLAARRRSQEDLERLRAAIPSGSLRLATEEHFALNKDFHSFVIEASGNTLLAIAAQPVFSVLQTHLARSRLGARFHGAVNQHHRAIAAAIAAGAAREAEREMRAHLQFLRPFYAKAWRYAQTLQERA
jgi:GntR family transcriptional regulator, transcriptional repressor for pyruvate dehydrogenase complex